MGDGYGTPVCVRYRSESDLFQGDDHGAVATTDPTAVRPATFNRFTPRDTDALDSAFAEGERHTSKKSQTHRKVLFIASRFPPVASVGAIRVRKFAKYLPHWGWQPVVITGAMRTTAPNAQDARRAADLESLSDIPASVPVHRLGAGMDHWPTLASRKLAGRLGALTHKWGWDAGWWSSLLSWRLERIHDALAFPDRGVWRLPSTVRLALSLHRKHKFDAIFTSGMPFSDHLVGLVLHESIRRPWIADFRDPWVEYIHWQQWESATGRRLTHAAEAAVVARAARVVSVNNSMSERFIERYGAGQRSKFVTIENGFDPNDFPQGTPSQAQSGFRLLYAGSLYKTRSPETLLDAFRRFIEETPGARSRCSIEFAGRPGPFAATIAEAGENVRYIGMLSHAATLRRMAEADVNVVLLPNLPGGLGDSTAKIYECLGSGRALLAIVPHDGAAARMLAGFDGVWQCNPDDAAQIAIVLGDLYRRWLSGDLQPDRPAAPLKQMTRQVQAHKLAECLNSATAAMSEE